MVKVNINQQINSITIFCRFLPKNHFSIFALKIAKPSRECKSTPLVWFSVGEYHSNQVGNTTCRTPRCRSFEAG